MNTNYSTSVLHFIVADDDEIVIEILKENVFKKNPSYQLVSIAYDGEELIDKCLSNHIDIVITDLEMPVMNGIKAIRKIKELNIPVKIIALSNYNNYEYYRYLKGLGVNGYVLKDLAYTFYELQKAIRQVVAGAFYLDSKIKVPKEGVMVHSYADPVAELIGYERRVVKLIYAGKTTKQISDELGKSPKTIEKYRSDIYLKLGVKNALELMKFIAVHSILLS